MLLQLTLAYAGYLLIFMTSVSVLVSRFTGNNKFASVTASFTAAFAAFVATVLPALPGEIPDSLTLTAAVVACMAGMFTLVSLHPRKLREGSNV